MSPDSEGRVAEELGAISRINRFQVAVYGLAFILSGAGCLGVEPRAEAPFTVVMLPDTQRYSMSRPDLFCAQTEWVKRARDRENIVFVTQVGDIINDRSKIMSQWTVASNAMARLDGVVPWGVTLGNHD